MTRKEAQTRNWNIFMFRGMAHRVCWITKALFESGLTKDEIKTVVKFNTIMNNKIKLLDDKIQNKPKKHKKQKILLISTPQSKGSIMEKMFRELESEGYCLVETKLIGDTITGASLESVIVDDFLVR